jgi:hypothetical protein
MLRLQKISEFLDSVRAQIKAFNATKENLLETLLLTFLFVDVTGNCQWCIRNEANMARQFGYRRGVLC